MKKIYAFIGAMIFAWLVVVALFFWGARLIKAPEISIQEVMDKARYPRGAVLQPKVTVSSAIDPSPRYTVTLNGKPYHGNPITQPGFYILKVKAQDRFGHRSMAVVSFYIDTQPAGETFELRPLLIRFERTEKDNVKIFFHIYIKSNYKNFDYEKYSVATSLDVNYQTNGWDFQWVRIWLAYPKRGGKPVGWVAECANIYSPEAASILRKAIHADPNNVLFDMLITYDAWLKPPTTSPDGVRGIFGGEHRFEYWSDPNPLRIDDRFIKAFYHTNKLVLYRGHPTKDGISDTPNKAMRIQPLLRRR